MATAAVAVPTVAPMEVDDGGAPEHHATKVHNHGDPKALPLLEGGGNKIM